MSFSFNPREGLIIVPAVVSGPTGDYTARLALDTGAMGSLIGLSILKSIGYDPNAAAGQARVTTGSGVVSVPRMIIEGIEALDRRRNDFPVLCHTLPLSAGVDGVRGLDFLRGHRLIIDFRAGLMILD